ncbi:MAG: GNAT family N-acetyltransferase, partial [Terracidiphilus sp.]
RRGGGGAAMIEIRSCRGHEEMEACVQLQVATWGYDPTDVIPRKAFLVAQKIGGQVIGAFDSELGDGPQALAGYALSWPGVKSGQGGAKPYLHSHMLAVREGYRDRGLGARLKWEQRRDALSRGVRLIEWTFDPLEIKNAFLNLCKLGAIARRYEVDFYGASTSRLQGGLPTDRLVAEWHLESERVERFHAGAPASRQAIEERIVVPAGISTWKGSDRDRDRALAVQLENRSRFQAAFAQGLAVIGFHRDADGNGYFELGDANQAASGLKPRGN